MPSSDRRTALVTGGSGGIGRACARMLAARDYDVVLVARRPDPLREAAEALGVRWIAGDCGEEADVERIFAQLDRLDVLVHAAGVYEGGLVRRTDAASLDRLYKANLRSGHLLARAALDVMEPGARMIFIGSIAGIEGTPTVSAYSATKAGLRAYLNALAGEVEHKGIGVHLVTTGAVDTPMFGADVQRVESLEPEEVAEVVGWLEAMNPHMVVREIMVRAVEEGPFASGKIGMKQAQARRRGNAAETPAPIQGQT